MNLNADTAGLADENKRLQAENAALKRSLNFLGWIEKFFGRILAIFVGWFAVVFLSVTISILSTDIRTTYFETMTVETMLVGSSQQKANSTNNPTKISDRPVQDEKINSVNKTTSHVELPWNYGLKVFGSIIVLFALLWTLLALVRSDQRD